MRRKRSRPFEATLITPNAPFDRFLEGDRNALSAKQQAGLALFMEKGCSSCHNGINIGGGMYAPFGVVEKPGAEFLPPGDKGRFMVTKTPSDEYVFRSRPAEYRAYCPYIDTGNPGTCGKPWPSWARASSAPSLPMTKWTRSRPFSA